jgi:DNA-binding PadR family transcriptional regulator
VNSPTNTQQAPVLPAAQFYILLALSHKSLHGYAIGAVASNHSLRSINLKPGALYPLLKKMNSTNLIEKAGIHATGPSGQERLHYRITSEGRYRVKHELLRYRHTIKVGETLGYFKDDLPPDLRRILDQLK